MTRQTGYLSRMFTSYGGQPRPLTYEARGMDPGGLVKYSRNTLVRLVVVMAALALVLSACGSSSKKSNNTKNPTSTGPTGSVVLGAEQWPSCVNPINQCANSSWLQWLAPVHVLPPLTAVDQKK